MIRLFIVLMLISSTCFGEINEKYSYKDFTNQSFIDVDASEFNDSEIKGSCFYQQKTGTRVFPNGIKNVIFTSNNLDNVYLEDIPDDIELNTIGIYISTNNNSYTKNTHQYVSLIDGVDWLVSKKDLVKIRKLNLDEEGVL